MRLGCQRKYWISLSYLPTAPVRRALARFEKDLELAGV